MLKAKFKFVTPDSVNMIFESLSSSGETYLFDMHSSRENKISRLVDEVKNNKYAGFLEEKYLENSEIKTISLNKPNTLHDTFREVEKIVYEIEKRFKNENMSFFSDTFAGIEQYVDEISNEQAHNHQVIIVTNKSILKKFNNNVSKIQFSSLEETPYRTFTFIFFNKRNFTKYYSYSRC